MFQNEKGYINWLKNDYLKDETNYLFGSPIKNYSGNMVYAWEIVRKMNERGYCFSINQDCDFEFDVYIADGYYSEDISKSIVVSHEKAERAICLDALKILGIEYKN